MKGWAVWGLLLGVAAALVLRCGHLAQRPLHNDEAINAFKLRDLWVDGTYRYDPDEFHGPALYYFSLPVLAVRRLLERGQPDEVGMRGVAVVFGVGLILLLGLLGRDLGGGSMVLAGFLTAVSPVMVYYSRYYIHEVPLVFFTFLTLAAGWRYVRRPHAGWAALTGAGLGLMYATKETFVFAVAAAGAAGLLTCLTGPGAGTGTGEGPGAPRSDWRVRLTRWAQALRRVSRRHLLIGLASLAAVDVLLFSSFFDNWRGPLDAVRTYAIWLHRAGGDSPHVHPWGFYFERLFWFQVRGGPWWSEGLVLLLAGAGAWASWQGADRSAAAGWLGRFATFYAVVLAAIYSLIPYKTPWCLLGFYQPVLVLAGLGGWSLMRPGAGLGGRWRRVAGGLLSVVAIGHLAGQSLRANGEEWAADFRNPWAYAHTSADVTNLLELVSNVARVSPEGDAMPLQVIAPDANYWPLPWYWRRFTKSGWWDHLPENPFSPVVVLASRLGVDLEAQSGQAWWLAGSFELRPRYFLQVYVERGLWQRFLEVQAAGSPEE